MTHTPAPWTVRRASKPDNVGGFDYAIFDDDGKIIAETFQKVDVGAERPCEANAKLIAAAPELLFALKEIMPFVGCDITGEHYEECVALTTLAVRAIAKAEGRSC